MVGAVLITGGAVAWYLWAQAETASRQELRIQTEQSASFAAALLESRISDYVEVLYGLRDVIVSQTEPSRADFNEYIDERDVAARLPGFQALEWARVVPGSELAEFEEAVRNDRSLDPEGYPDFTVHPAADRDLHIVVEYVEPMPGNEAAFGFDLASNPARLAAIQKAADLGVPVATGPITLVQESGDQRGFLMLVPSFRDDELAGVLVAVFRVEDLLSDALGTAALPTQVHDSTDGLRRTLYAGAEDESGVTATRRFTVGTRTWRLVVGGDATPGVEVATPVPLLVAVLATTLAIAMVVIIAGRAQDRAVRMTARATAALDELNAELRRSNRDLANFASVASHDLQTPVRNITNAIALLREDLSDGTTDTVPEYLEIIESSGNRMQRLVASILEYANVNRGDESASSGTDLEQIVFEILDTREREIQEANATIEVGTLPRAVIDDVQAFRLLDNIIGNAIKYRDPGRAPEIDINAQLQGASVVVSVSDNGIGFDDGDEEAVFKMFKRLHGDGEYPGTGMGLAIAKRVVEQYGGSISAASTPGVGSTFTISLPAA